MNLIVGWVELRPLTNFLLNEMFSMLGKKSNILAYCLYLLTKEKPKKLTNLTNVHSVKLLTLIIKTQKKKKTRLKNFKPRRFYLYSC